MADIGVSRASLARLRGVSRAAITHSLSGSIYADNAAVLLDVLGYDLIAMPRRGTKAADGTKARPYTIDPPKRDKLGDGKPEGKIEG